MAIRRNRPNPARPCSARSGSARLTIAILLLLFCAATWIALLIALFPAHGRRAASPGTAAQRRANDASSPITGERGSSGPLASPGPAPRSAASGAKLATEITGRIADRDTGAGLGGFTIAFEQRDVRVKSEKSGRFTLPLGTEATPVLVIEPPSGWSLVQNRLELDPQRLGRFPLTVFAYRSGTSESSP